MKRKIFCTLLLTAFATLSTFAQKSMLVAYDGGYFVKNEKEWSEYRPGDRAGKWSTYKQYKESEEFFYLKNKKCRLAIPKLAKDKIFIDRKKEGKWEVVYNPLDIYTLCTEGEGIFYCYTGTQNEYDGYFVRDNQKWREYRPGMKRSLWAEFEQCDETAKYFIIESKHNKVYIPKNNNENFVIKDKDDDNWRGGYKTNAVYDHTALYPYNFYFENSFIVKRNNEFKANGNNARISLDNKNNIQIAIDGKFHNYIYASIQMSELDGKEAILITIDSKNRVWLFEDGTCRIECKKIDKKRLLIGGTVNKYKEIASYLRSGTFKL